MENDCKNYIHKYKCNSYAENPDNCKNCELKLTTPVVYAIRYSTIGNGYLITTDDPRAEGIQSNLIPIDQVFSAMREIAEALYSKGYKASFEVV